MQSAVAEQRNFEPEEEEQASAPVLSSGSDAKDPAGTYTGVRRTEREVRTIEVEPTDSMSLYVMPSPNFRFRETVEPLVPTMFRDVFRHAGVYLLIFLMVGLALFKVYQVQQTRNLTATLNEIVTDNDNLQKEWLALLAQRQDLSAHTKIRAQAKAELGMIQPKTAQEILITLD